MRASPKFRRAHEAGFTVVEGLIAALLLAVILVGILPLIDRAKQNNLQGNDATYESNAIVDRLETLYSLPFFHVDLTLADGATSLTADDWFLQSTRVWTETEPTDSDKRYTRSSTVEYFSSEDLENELDANNTGTFDSPIAGMADLEAAKNAVQFKRITLVLDRQRIFDTSPYRVVAIKAY
jgi:Tfp pilus assembly protein PilV